MLQSNLLIKDYMNLMIKRKNKNKMMKILKQKNLNNLLINNKYFYFFIIIFYFFIMNIIINIFDIYI